MRDELITFKTAKLTKEKGFNLPTYVGFGPRGGQASGKLSHYKRGNLTYPRPTQTFLQRWLREQHWIRVYPTNKFAGDFGFEIYISNPDKEKIVGQPWVRLPGYMTKHFRTYEEALEEALKEGLKLILL